MTQDIEKSLKYLSNTFKASCILGKPEVCKYIDFLRAGFFIVPVDKSRNNFGIVCKKFYLDVIKN